MIYKPSISSTYKQSKSKIFVDLISLVNARCSQSPWRDHPPSLQTPGFIYHKIYGPISTEWCFIIYKIQFHIVYGFNCTIRYSIFRKSIYKFLYTLHSEILSPPNWRTLIQFNVVLTVFHIDHISQGVFKTVRTTFQYIIVLQLLGEGRENLSQTCPTVIRAFSEPFPRDWRKMIH